MWKGVSSTRVLGRRWPRPPHASQHPHHSDAAVRASPRSPKGQPGTRTGVVYLGGDTKQPREEAGRKETRCRLPDTEVNGWAAAAQSCPLSPLRPRACTATRASEDKGAGHGLSSLPPTVEGCPGSMGAQAGAGPLWRLRCCGPWLEGTASAHLALHWVLDPGLSMAQGPGWQGRHGPGASWAALRFPKTPRCWEHKE